MTTERDSATTETTDTLMQPDANVQRIMWTGTIWFTAAVSSSAILLGFLLSSGWRPAVLDEPLQFLWWLGSFLVAASIGLIGWSGCPILEVSVPVASHNKSRTMQFGTAMFILGGILTTAVVLLGPAA